MATQRYISTSFWNDPWVQTLTPNEKFLYLYLLTNPLTNIAGAYEITERRIVFDTGLTSRQVNDALCKFTHKEKAVRYEDWIILPAWPDHQRWQKSDRIQKGIETILEALPSLVLGVMDQVGYRYPIHTLSLTLAYPPCYLDTDSDLDSDSDTDSNSDPIRPVGVSRKKQSNYPPDFEKLWQLYPGTAGSKKEAYAEYKKAPIGADEMAVALQNQIEFKAKQEKTGEFVASWPHMCRWIKHERWTDKLQLEAPEKIRKAVIGIRDGLTGRIRHTDMTDDEIDTLEASGYNKGVDGVYEKHNNSGIVDL